MKKRLLCLLVMAFCLALVVPGRAQAVATSGTCGENATWSFDETTDTLTISGTGKVDNKDRAPWYDFDDEIKRVVIENGITNIPYSAFCFCRELTEVVIPESVVTIESSAFRGCKNLKSIDLHDGIAELGSLCFEDAGLTEVTIPKAVTVIPFAAFRGCRSLTKVNFHDRVTEIVDHAFDDCYDLQQVTIPDSVTTIGSCAFYGCANMTEVTLSKNISAIPYAMFRDCTKLQEIVIPDSVTNVEEYAFENTGLEYVTLGAGVTVISRSAFNECTKIKAYSVSDFNAHFSTDAHNALYNKDKTELIFAPKGLAGAYTVREGTKMIGVRAFQDCVHLTEIILPDSIQEFGDYAFYNCTNLKEMKLPKSLQTIGEFAFSDCDSLQELVIPASVTEVKREFIGYCDQMAYLIFIGKPPEFDELALSGFSQILYYPRWHTEWKTVDRLLCIKATWVSYDCTDHDTVKTPAKEPTCMEEGLSKGEHCALCGKIIVAQQTIPAKGHAFGEWKVVDTTPEDATIEERTCVNCGHTEQRKTQSPNPTDPVITDPQATEPAATDPQATDATEVTDTPTEPTQEATLPTDAPTEPTQLPTDPTQPDITVKEESKTFPWVIVVIAVAAIGAAVGGVILGKKRK